MRQQWSLRKGSNGDLHRDWKALRHPPNVTDTNAAEVGNHLVTRGAHAAAVSDSRACLTENGIEQRRHLPPENHSHGRDPPAACGEVGCSKTFSQGGQKPSREQPRAASPAKLSAWALYARGT